MVRRRCTSSASLLVGSGRVESALAYRTDDDDGGGTEKADRATSSLCVLKVLLDGAKACDEFNSRRKERVDV